MNEFDFTEKTVASKEIFKGKILHVFHDEIVQSNGTHAFREIIRHNGGVCVVPITDKGEIVCVKQFRYPFAATMIEIPAGKLDSKAEDHRSAALRELREETGFACEKLTFLGEMYGSPAILEERIYMYMAEGLIPGECDPDEDEIIETHTIPMEKMIEMIMNGEINDAKTQLAVLKAARILGHN